MKNFLYCIQFEKTEGVKIGVTDVPKARVSTLELAHGKVKNISVYRTEMASQLEALIHATFKHLNTPADVGADGYTEFFNVNILDDIKFKSLLELYDLVPIDFKFEAKKSIVAPIKKVKIPQLKVSVEALTKWDEHFDYSINRLKAYLNALENDLTTKDEGYYLFNNCFNFDSPRLSFHLNPFYSFSKRAGRYILEKHSNMLVIENLIDLEYFDPIKVYEFLVLIDVVKHSPLFPSFQRDV